MLEKAKVDSVDIDATVKWICPHCKRVHITKISVNPYRSLAEDPPDEQCENCRQFVTLNFYDD